MMRKWITGVVALIGVLLCGANENMAIPLLHDAENNSERVTTTEEATITINLPSIVYACEGLETNIYFENLTDQWDQYYWDLHGAVGMQTERGFQFTPTADDVGEYDLSVLVADGDKSKLTKTKIVVSPRTKGDGKTVSIIVLGDSTTDSGYVISCLHENFSIDPMNLITLGTRGIQGQMHEGRSGWTLNDYFTLSSEEYNDARKVIENPFYNPAAETFDASWYFDHTGVDKPDWFFINMGINDMFSCKDDDEAYAKAEECIDYLNRMIISVKDASPRTRIGICLTIPPNHSQDAFGKAYGLWQTRERCKRNNTILVSKLIEKFDNRSSEGIYLVPIHLALDTIWNMGVEMTPVNARNKDRLEVSPIKNGGVHPAVEGYWQIADVYTAFIKAYADLETES